MGDRVCDWMTRDPVHVEEDLSALDALDRMVDRGIRHLPVVDSDRQVIGILSLDDLRAAFPFEVSTKCPPEPAERREARDYRVSDAMTWAPQTVRASEPLQAAARRLAELRIGCLPVVDEHGRLEGILSETDALHALDVLLRRGRGPTPARPKGGTEALVDALWEERERLVEQLAKWQHSNHEAGDPVDERGVAARDSTRARASRRLRAIEGALERAESGGFGICERCQDRIPSTRLRSRPEATLCVRCARVTARASASP